MDWNVQTPPQTQPQQINAQSNASVYWVNIKWGTSPFKVTSADTKVVTVGEGVSSYDFILTLKGKGTSVITATDSKGVTNKMNFTVP